MSRNIAEVSAPTTISCGVRQNWRSVRPATVAAAVARPARPVGAATVGMRHAWRLSDAWSGRGKVIGGHGGLRCLTRVVVSVGVVRCRASDGQAASAVGVPVRVRNTSSRVGRRRPMSSMATSPLGQRRARPRPAGRSRRRPARRPGGPARRPAAARRRARRARRATSPTSSARRTRTSTTSRPARPFSSSGVPVAMARPWSTIVMRSASWSASSRYCVVSSTSVPAAHERPDGLPQLHAAAGVEAGGRLVEQQQPGCADQAGAEVEAPAHAARVAAHQPVGRLSSPSWAEHGVGRGRRAAGGRGRTGGPPSRGSPGRSSPARRRRAGRPGR